MADSDLDDSFTFGSFTLEDTKEFKKNYDGLGTKDTNDNSKAVTVTSPAPASGPSSPSAAAARDPRPRSPSPSPKSPKSPSPPTPQAAEEPPVVASANGPSAGAASNSVAAASELVAAFETVTASKPVALAKPVAASKREPLAVSKPDPIGAPKPDAIAKPEPVAASKPVAGSKPVGAFKHEPVAMSKPVASSKPVVASKPDRVAAPKSVAASKSVTASKSNAVAASNAIAASKPVATSKPVAAVVDGWGGGVATVGPTAVVSCVQKQSTTPAVATSTISPPSAVGAATRSTPLAPAAKAPSTGVISWASIAAGRAKPAPPPAPAVVPAGLPRQTQSSSKGAATGLEATPSTVTRGDGNTKGVRNTPPVVPSEGDNKGVVNVAGGTSSWGEGGKEEVLCGDSGWDGSGSCSSTTPLGAALPASLTEQGKGVGKDEEAGTVKGDPADAVVVDDEAAREKAKVEADAKAAEEAELLAERRWGSLLGMLGRENVPACAAGAGVGNELVHRGLVNAGNSCFRSAVLQALLACEPFVGVLSRAGPGLRESIPAQEALPTWAQLARFTAAFKPPKPGMAAPPGGRGGRGGGGKRGGGGAWSTPVGRNRGARHQRSSGAPEPVLPDDTMSQAFGAFRSANKGEQEDAQEFLAFFLDQLHEEIVKAKTKYEAEKKSGGADGGARGGVGNGGTATGGGGGGGGGGVAAKANNSAEEDKQEDAWVEVEKAEEDDAWVEVGKGGAMAVVNSPDPRARVSHYSVVTGLFYGMFRSEVKKSGTAKSSVTLEPFHCLQLDLDPPGSHQNGGNANEGDRHSGNNNSWGATNGGHGAANGGGVRGRGGGGGAGGGGAWGIAGGRTHGGGAAGVGGAWEEGVAAGGGGGAWGGAGVTAAGAGATVLDEALAALFGGETVAGVKGRQNLEVKASRILTLDQAPKVLTLHLKQFAFHTDLGPRKLARRVRYPLELTVPTKIMSPSLQHQAAQRGPLKYRLFTVVLHHGRSLHGGHYTALVRDARGQWRHCDDQNVSPETEGNALNPMSGHPYLLLYTRM